MAVRPAAPSVHIVADARECRSPVWQLLTSESSVRLETRRLEAGDYEVEGEWVFERKTVQDFSLSLVDGRLFGQAHRLAQCPGGRAMIVEGADPEIVKTGVSRESWQGAMVSLALSFQLPILRSENAEQTVRLLLYAARQMKRQREVVFIPTSRQPRTLERQKMRVLAALPGVGPHRARLLLQHFGSVEAAVLAAEDELTEIHGIGLHTARRIRRVVAANPHEWECRGSGSGR